MFTVQILSSVEVSRVRKNGQGEKVCVVTADGVIVLEIECLVTNPLHFNGFC